ncbi:helix-turn-helix domain-containing protein [Streptomyces sparsogenes]
MTPPQVARRLRVSRKSAYAWHARWLEGGVQALRSKGASGRPSRMTPNWRAWLAAELEKGPAAHGWVEHQLSTLARVATVIARRGAGRVPPPVTCPPRPGRCRLMGCIRVLSRRGRACRTRGRSWREAG